MHKLNRKLFVNYLEIYIKSDFDKIKSKKKKIFYRKKFKNVWGQDIKPQFPRKPDIVIQNNFDKSISKLSGVLIKKIDKRLIDD